MRTILKILYSISKKFVETLIQFFSILIFTKLRFINNLKSNKSSKNKLVILGNGPSLTGSLDKIIEIHNSSEYDFICVNQFANSEYFEKLKPNYYMLVDPIYFKETPDNKRVNSIKKELKINLVRKVDWHLTLYIPRYYIQSSFIQSLSANQYVRIVPLNNVPLLGGFEKIKQFLFEYDLGTPFWRNVLIAAIFIGIQKEYKRIILYGADHSWLNNLKVLPNNNIILDDKHLNRYDLDEIVLTDEEGNPKKLHVFIQQMYFTFREYHVLNKYAEKKGIKILNMTDNSFIDAFERDCIIFS